MAQNPDSALKLGQAGGCLGESGSESCRIYGAADQTVCVGYGAADKEQVQMMVMRILNLTIKPQQMLPMRLLLPFVMPCFRQHE